MLTISVWSFGRGKHSAITFLPALLEEQPSSLPRLPSRTLSAALGDSHWESKRYHDFSSLLFQHHILPAFSFSLAYKDDFPLLHLSLKNKFLKPNDSSRTPSSPQMGRYPSSSPPLPHRKTKDDYLTEVLSEIRFLDEMPSSREGGRRSYICSQFRTSAFELTLTWKHWRSELLGKGGGNPLSWLGTLADLAWQKRSERENERKTKGFKKKKQPNKKLLSAQ